MSGLLAGGTGAPLAGLPRGGAAPGTASGPNIGPNIGPAQPSGPMAAGERSAEEKRRAARANGRLLVSLGAAIAIAGFFVSLVLACMNLLHMERNLQPHPGESVVWLASQGQYEAMRLLDTASRREAGAAELDASDLQLRYDLMMSRLMVLQEGRPATRVARAGMAAVVAEQVDRAAALEPEVQALEPGSALGLARLRATLLPLAAQLRDLANVTLLEEQQGFSELRQQRNAVISAILFYVIGVLASGVVLMLVLLRERKAHLRAEARLEREREVSRLHRAFVSMVSHQFRTPLAIIDSSAQRMIRRGVNMPTEEIATRANKIREATRRLTRLMESTLNAARLDAGEINLNPRDCDPRLLVREVVDSQREAAAAAVLDERLDGLPARIVCDPTLVEQAVANLVSNAVKYSPPGATVLIEGRTGPAGEAVLTIADQGVGIPADEIERIFERFFRARTSEGISGTGIGLAFARHVARMHGGEVEAASQEGVGSVFTLTLPASALPPTGREAAARARPAWA